MTTPALEVIEQFENEDDEVPGYSNYLVYCDESGMHGTPFYAFGSLWMPWERRGDFSAKIQALRRAHRMRDEIKWHNINRRNLPFYVDLVEMFFQTPWLMFHCLLAERAAVDKSRHDGDWDLARRKHFVMLLKNKIQRLSRVGGGAPRKFHIRVDRLPSRYAKADEAAEKILNRTLVAKIGEPVVASLLTRDSKVTPGIGLADLLLGAIMDEWCGASTGDHKQELKKKVAGHLGWADLKADTRDSVWKFNIWNFYDPTSGRPRRMATRPVALQTPVNL